MQAGSYTTAEPENPFERIFEGLWHHAVLVMGLWFGKQHPDCSSRMLPGNLKVHIIRTWAVAARDGDVQQAQVYTKLCPVMGYLV